VCPPGTPFGGRPPAACGRPDDTRCTPVSRGAPHRASAHR
jgi:hypothetical protein